MFFAFVQAFLAYIFNYKAWGLMGLWIFKALLLGFILFNYSWDTLLQPWWLAIWMGVWEDREWICDFWQVQLWAFYFPTMSPSLWFLVHASLCLVSGEARGRVNRVCLYEVLLTALFAAAVLLCVPALAPEEVSNRTVSLSLCLYVFSWCCYFKKKKKFPA